MRGRENKRSRKKVILQYFERKKEGEREKERELEN